MKTIRPALCAALAAAGAFTGANAAVYEYEAAPGTFVHLNIYDYGEPFQSMKVYANPGDTFDLSVDDVQKIVRLNIDLSNVQPDAGGGVFGLTGLSLETKFPYSDDPPFPGFDPAVETFVMRYPVT
jgi:hypothetical protein